MVDLRLEKVNEAFIKVVSERNVAQELSDYFTFYVPGYQYTPAFKARYWDGKIRLLDLRTMEIYHGLVPYIEKFCKERDYKIEIDSEITVTDSYSLKEANDFIATLGLPFEPRDYQVNSFVHAIRNKRILLLSPTASGKSLIIYLMLRYIQQTQSKGLLVVPTTSLVEQMYTDFQSYGYDSEEFCHRQYAGKDKVTDKFLTITTWQSIYKNPPEYFSQFDFVIGDEAHQFKAKSLATIMSCLTDTKYRIGCTGTLDGTQTHRLVLEGLFGPVYKATTTAELIDKGQLASFRIKCLILKYPDAICKMAKDWDYNQEVEYIVMNAARNEFIKNLTLSLKGNSLILFQFVEKHGRDLHALIKQHTKNRQVFFVYGGTDVEVRESIRSITDFHNKNTITLSFDDYEVLIDGDEFVPLINLPQKKAKDITENDDIDTSILINRIKASTLKGHIVWTNKN
jgi:superfamily II DNA or RNA helicase